MASLVSLETSTSGADLAKSDHLNEPESSTCFMYAAKVDLASLGRGECSDAKLIAALTAGESSTGASSAILSGEAKNMYAVQATNETMLKTRTLAIVGVA